MYDVTNKESFDSIKNWVTELKTHLEFNNLVVMLIGNKSDLEDKRQVTEEQGRALAQELDFFFMETSALKNATNEVSKAFMVIIEEILNRNPDVKGKTGQKVETGQKVDTKDKKKGGCC